MEDSITISKAEYEKLLGFEKEVQWLKHQLSQLQRLLFGQKRERFIATDPAQGTLFDLPATEAAEPVTEEISYTREKPVKENKKHPLRAELPAHLPRKTEIIEPENLPEGAKKIGELITEVLEYKPERIYVRRIVRPKYVIESTDEGTRIETAQLPSLPIPKGNAGPSMIAHILVSKFADHLPYYRQSGILKREGLQISPSTIGGWANKAIALWLSPLWEEMKKGLLASDYLQADETPIPVLTEDKPGAAHKGYLWVYHSPPERMAVFEYHPGRGSNIPKDFLKDFEGYLQSDGYVAYDNLGPKKHNLACLAHVRRRFEHSLDNDLSRAKQALEWIGRLYDIERQARDGNWDNNKLRMEREKKAVPVLKEMEAWMIHEYPSLFPKSAIAGAMQYSLKLWPRIKDYVLDGRLQIDNNLIENQIRPVAIGRKNYLFAGSHEGAEHAAIIYSLLATCKLRGVEPFAWLKNVLEVIPDYPANKLKELLPALK